MSVLLTIPRKPFMESFFWPFKVDVQLFQGSFLLYKLVGFSFDIKDQ